MKRFDLALIVPLLLLALFVGHEALGEWRHSKALALRTASFGATRAYDAPAPSPDVPVEVVASPSLTSAPVFAELRSKETEARTRLDASSSGTYIGDVLLDRDSALARWPDRSAFPLRVWIQPTPRLVGFSPTYPPLIRKAFATWSETGIPLPFTFVTDSGLADVHVSWIDHFDESISGKTLWAHDGNWWIIDAQIVIALHHKSGEALDQAAIQAIALHEVGHLIGLDHTSDTTAIMTPKVRVKDLSAADRATAQLLYMLPPGRFGSGAGR